MKRKNILVITLFLLGIFIGAVDSGIVSPAREIISNSFGVKQNIGVWMITIYTLAYAVSMPIVSKLADRYGYNVMYIFGITTFGIGSLLCGFSNYIDNFGFFLFARVVQAIGAGGIIPIATAFIGKSISEEKRGLALGLVGGVYGIANILGPTLGSFILGLVGDQSWGWLFFINIPFVLFILFFSGSLTSMKTRTESKLDFVGAILTAGVIVSFMYALTNVDFFDFVNSIKSVDVYPYFLVFLVLLPILVYVESNTKDPIINVKYFKNRQMLVAFALALVVGTGLMGMVFVPQFAENVLQIKAGTGGYLVTLLAVFSGFAAPFSGKLIDEKGAGFTMRLGFFFTIAGSLVLGLLATEYLNFITVFLGLALMGFGVGFSMGAPLNYVVLQAVPENESAEALATMSLIRSVGVTVSPSLMIGFIVQAAKDLPSKLMTVVQTGFADMMPKDMMAMAGGNGGSMFASLQSADVTTIAPSMHKLFENFIPDKALPMFNQQFEVVKPQIINVFQSTINHGYSTMFMCASLIALVGIFFTYFLKDKPKAPKNTDAVIN